MFPKSREDLVEILEELLQLNPYMRPTAKELLKHPIFDSVRIKENEIHTDYKINIEMDRNNPINYDEELLSTVF